MTGIYGDQHRALQEQFGAVPLADRVRDVIVAPAITEHQRAFIEGRDLFFLTTVDHRGFPTVSYKGGATGFVRVLDAGTLAFPSYDGNGMFLSMGNITTNPKVGMLFIDFEHPNRIRVHGTATVTASDPLLATYPGADLVVRVAVTEIFQNCPRYVHAYQRVATSKYVPQAECPAPPAQWKRIDGLQDVLPPRDRGLAEASGGVITMEQYGELLGRGEA
jgi:predicted pyridoxine 5'-phosphate oxidase superfamily flavin-nucleotide-binding protein